MNKSMGLLGRKLGCSQVFDGEGLVHRVTVIEVGPCTVIDRRTDKRDGYWALVLGFGDKPAKQVSQPEMGIYAKEGSALKAAGIAPRRNLREFRLPKETVEKFEIGQNICASDLFTPGQFVDVTGTTKGRGFAGVIKRHGFKGSKDSHGAHEYFRHGGSIGQNMTPGRTFKGLRMPGHYGNVRMTTQNLKVVDVDAEKNIVLVNGAVPGRTRGVVMVRHAVKKAAKPTA